MLPSIKMKLDNNINLKKYLRENSFYYKDLERNPLFINELEKRMMSSYKLTTSDKIKSFGNKLELISTLLDVLK